MKTMVYEADGKLHTGLPAQTIKYACRAAGNATRPLPVVRSAG